VKLSKMAPIFEQLSFKLPLQIDSANILPWLSGLDPDEAYNSCGKLLRLLKSLETEALETDAEYGLLCHVSLAFERIGAKFEKSLLDAGNPIGLSERINTEMIIFGHAELAQRFWNVSQALAERREDEDQEKVTHALFNALEALRRALLYICFLYDRPYEGFWQACYRIYLQAESQDLPAAATNDYSVEHSFKSLLLFYLSDPGQLTQREMKALYSLFQRRPITAKIYRQIDEEKIPLVFAFALESDAPPRHAPLVDLPPTQLRYISTIKTARMAYTYVKDGSGNRDKTDAGNYSLYCKLAKVLSMKASRQYSRVTEQRECRALFGFNNVFNYLNQKSSIARPLHDKSPSLPQSGGGLSWDIPDLNLVPRGEEDLFRMKEGNKIEALGDVKLKNLFSDDNYAATAEQQGVAGYRWSSDKRKFIFETVAIVNSSAKGYTAIRRNIVVPVKVGDLLGILNPSDDRIEVAMIRRIAYYEQENAELGLELICLQAGIAAVWRSDKAFYVQTVLFLPGLAAIQQPDTIIFPGHTFSTGDMIFMQHGEKKIACGIAKLLHATPAFTHAELSFPEEKTSSE
jgi:hypothetical protein